MAKIIEQLLEVKFSKIVKDSEESSNVLTDEMLEGLLASIPELAESIIDDVNIVVEVVDFKTIGVE